MDGANAGQVFSVTYAVNETPVRRCLYEYWENGDDHGSTHDLKLVTLQQYGESCPPPSSSSAATWVTLGKVCYRYYIADGETGFKHGIKYVFGPEACVRAALPPGFDPADDAVPDEDVAPFANHYFEYDTAKRVTKESVNGALLTYTYAYHSSGLSDGYNTWNVRTTETLPDGNKNVVYTNHVGQVMLKVFEKTGTADKWYDYTRYDERTRTILRAASSAVESVDEGDSFLVTLKEDAGLIYTAEYYPDDTTDPGAAPGYLQFERVQQGEDGTSSILRELQYTVRDVGGDKIYPVSKLTVFRDEAGTEPSSTEYEYTWFTDSFQVQDLTAILPPVPTSQNGTNTPHSRITRHNEWGQPVWQRDERGIMTAFSWSALTGGPLQRIDDAGTGTPWTPTPGDHLNLITDYQADNLGRMTQELGPTHHVDLAGTSTLIRRARYSVYLDELLQQWNGVGYATGSGPSYTYQTVGPIQMVYRDFIGRVTNVVSAPRALSGALNACDSFPQSDWCRFARFYFDDKNRLFKTQVYHDIPASGTGSIHTNYEETEYGYDAMMRRNRVKTSGGTVTRTVFDARGLVASIWVGTNDTGATDSNPAGSGSPNNMVKVQEFEYDGGVAGLDGLLTEATAYADGSDTRVTAFAYDWRNRRASVDGEVDFFQCFSYDNLNRLICTEQRDTDDSGALAWSRETRFDDRGRVFQIVRQGTDGASGPSLTDNVWYDDSGNVTRRLPAGSNAFTKFAYDNLGRATTSYLAYGPGNLTGDTVIEQREMSYDAASNLIQQTLRRRFHDATGAGALGDPTTAPHARVSYLAMYPDAVGRGSRRADYGTNGGASFTRPAVAPAPSATILVTRTEFNDRGEPYRVTDPMERVVESSFDDAGRLTKTVENKTAGSGADENRTTEFAYNPDSRLGKLTAVNSTTGNQETIYTYGATLSNSDVASVDLLRAIQYPDSTGGSDVVTLGYNRLGQVKKRTDQAGTVHDYLYDKLGRITDDQATSLGSGIDGAVRRISRAYEYRGMLKKITSYNAATGGDPVNEVELEYNGFGQLAKDWQAHGGVVSGSSPKCQYGYASGTANTLRLTSVTYPDGRVLDYDYGAANAINDQLSRIRAIVDGGDDVVAYQYLGLSEFVEVAYEEPGVELTYLKQGSEGNGDAGDKYAGLDRFYRVVDQRWIKGTTDLERVQYGFNANSSRVWRDNVVAGASGKQDEYYTNDGLNQLKELDRGDLNSGKTGIDGTPTWEEQFTLDPTGNWPGYKTLTNGSTTLDQARTHNKANELTQIDGSGTHVAEDPAGNMTKVPKLDNWSSHYDLKYDAWNRLVEVKDGSTTVATYRYDGLTRRVTKLTGSTTRHYYYSSQWQILEERLDSSMDADRQFVWGLRYVDDLTLRDRDTNSNGDLDERLFTLHDYFHPTALTDTAGDVKERLGYDAYGTSRLMNASFGTSSPTPPDYQWETRFGAYRWDGETGMYQVRNRSLHPLLGRWVSRDPVARVNISNLYEYVRNHPTNAIDVLGLEEKTKLDLLNEDYLRKKLLAGSPNFGAFPTLTLTPQPIPLHPDPDDDLTPMMPRMDPDEPVRKPFVPTVQTPTVKDPFKPRDPNQWPPPRPWDPNAPKKQVDDPFDAALDKCLKLKNFPTLKEIAEDVKDRILEWADEEKQWAYPVAGIIGGSVIIGTGQEISGTIITIGPKNPTISQPTLTIGGSIDFGSQLEGESVVESIGLKIKWKPPFW